RQDRSRHLARDARLDEALLCRVRVVIDRLELVAGAVGELRIDGFEGVGARLADLATHVTGLRDVEVLGGARVSQAELVERTDPVSEPLARDEDRAADVVA